ncbi:hypothetical protein GTA08_BOTSDO05949 [Botryosphaeria dothidea]|uniref:Acyl-protein thioesterase 1 n=1 Tax=Botryosphaeria dothidea TaxID=55169 RepID=A0A8H4ITI1_9PEZI|nr:hypothetical protein GTA08_BOTSDO05949 [Botryosphaeria dothidea]
MVDKTLEDSTPPMSKTKRKQTIWPDLLVINPTAPHTHTIILLHGRGSNAERFGLELVNAATTSAGNTLAELFPAAKFVFPTAKKRRSTILKRVPINQWFDNHSLEDPSECQHLQYDGLRETGAFVHGLVEREAAAVGAGRVVVGGLSQGCAAALHALLSFGEGGEALAGFVGMSGWLPFAETLDPRGRGGPGCGDGEEEGGGEDGVVFGSDGDEGEDGEGGGAVERSVCLGELQVRAANAARDIASLPSLSSGEVPLFPRTPIFLGHGRNDEKVSVRLGQQARDVLLSLGCQVRWEDYDEGHWYKVPEEIDDLANFLGETVRA